MPISSIGRSTRPLHSSQSVRMTLVATLALSLPQPLGRMDSMMAKRALPT